MYSRHPGPVSPHARTQTHPAHTNLLVVHQSCPRTADSDNYACIMNTPASPCHNTHQVTMRQAEIMDIISFRSPSADTYIPASCGPVRKMLQTHQAAGLIRIYIYVRHHPQPRHHAQDLQHALNACSCNNLMLFKHARCVRERRQQKAFSRIAIGRARVDCSQSNQPTVCLVSVYSDI